MSKIFGGSKNKQVSSNSSTSSSFNRAYEPISQLFLPQGYSNYTQGNSGVQEILGGSFEDYKKSSGFDFLKEMGIRGTMGQYGSGGVAQSGAAMKALQGFGQNLSQTFADRYLAGRQGQANAGLNVGQLVGQTGNVAQSSSRGTGVGSGSSTPGLAGFIGSILGSERRIKTNIQKLGMLEDGLGIYIYEYKDNPGLNYIGTMVEEVENLRPWALGPVNEKGYKTVDYSKLNSGEKE